MSAWPSNPEGQRIYRRMLKLKAAQHDQVAINLRARNNDRLRQRFGDAATRRSKRAEAAAAALDMSHPQHAAAVAKRAREAQRSRDRRIAARNMSTRANRNLVSTIWRMREDRAMDKAAPTQAELLHAQVAESVPPPLDGAELRQLVEWAIAED